MRSVPFALLSRVRRGLSICFCGSALLLPKFAAAQDAPAGTMKQDAASSGKADIASEGFASAGDDKHADDATEAKIQAGGLSASGNSRSLALTSLASVRARRGANEISAAIAANYGRSAASPADSVQTTIENYQGKIRYDRFVSEPLALFTSLTGRRDRFQGLDMRLNLDPGLAYYFVQGPKQQLWLEAGYDLQFDIRRDAAIATALTDGEILGKTKTRHSTRLFAG